LTCRGKWDGRNDAFDAKDEPIAGRHRDPFARATAAWSVRQRLGGGAHHAVDAPRHNGQPRPIAIVAC